MRKTIIDDKLQKIDRTIVAMAEATALEVSGPEAGTGSQLLLLWPIAAGRE
jgi:hypothetical protein